jgi:hypothetical protein
VAVDLGSQLSVIELAYAGGEIRAQRWQVTGGRIGFCLRDGPGTRNHSRNALLLRHPRQGRLGRRSRKRQPRDKISELLRSTYARLLVHTGEGLAHIECLAAAVEISMIILGEGGGGGVRPTEQAAGQRNARDDPYPVGDRGRQHSL